MIQHNGSVTASKKDSKQIEPKWTQLVNCDPLIYVLLSVNVDKRISVTFVLGALESVSVEHLKICSRVPPKSLRPSAADAFLLFQVCHIAHGSSSLFPLVYSSWFCVAVTAFVTSTKLSYVEPS